MTSNKSPKRSCDDLLNATTKQKVITAASQSPSLCSYKLLSEALTCEEKKNSFMMAFLHRRSRLDMPAPVRLLEPNDWQNCPVLRNRQTITPLKILSQTSKSVHAKLHLSLTLETASVEKQQPRGELAHLALLLLLTSSANLVLLWQAKWCKHMPVFVYGCSRKKTWPFVCCIFVQ